MEKLKLEDKMQYPLQRLEEGVIARVCMNEEETRGKKDSKKLSMPRRDSERLQNFIFPFVKREYFHNWLKRFFLE